MLYPLERGKYYSAKGHVGSGFISMHREARERSFLIKYKEKKHSAAGDDLPEIEVVSLLFLSPGALSGRSVCACSTYARGCACPVRKLIH